MLHTIAVAVAANLFVCIILALIAVKYISKNFRPLEESWVTFDTPPQPGDVIYLLVEDTEERHGFFKQKYFIFLVKYVTPTFPADPIHYHNFKTDTDEFLNFEYKPLYWRKA